nr:MAG TPA: hypothetical protein [Caudoviricetes sp.]
MRQISAGHSLLARNSARCGLRSGRKNKTASRRKRYKFGLQPRNRPCQHQEQRGAQAPHTQPEVPIQLARGPDAVDIFKFMLGKPANTKNAPGDKKK